MKIYINTENQLPVFASTLPTITEENGVLRVYEQGSSGTVSSLIFKRGTTVSIEFVLVGTGLEASQINDLAFGIKLKGKYDDFLVIEAAAESYEATDEGISCKVTAVFDSQVIDNALAVNGDSSDDIESADFIGAVSWKGADGQVTETATLDVEIRNNVIRDGDGIAGDGLPSGVQWTALMVVRMSWADYQALCDAGGDREDVLYVCPDAPDKETELGESISALEERVTVNESDISAIEKNYDALEQRVDNIDANGAGDLSEYAKLDAENTFTAKNTFTETVYLTKVWTNTTLAIQADGAGIILQEDYVCLSTSGSDLTVSNSGVSIRCNYSGVSPSAIATYNGAELATVADLTGYAKLTGADFTGTLSVNGSEVALESDLTGYAKLDTAQTWTAQQHFSANLSGNIAYLNEVASTGSALAVTGAYGLQLNSKGEFNIVVSDGYAAKLNGEEIATKADIKDVDLTGYAKLTGADFTGTVTVNGSEVALKSDIKDVDLTGYAKEDWVKEYHSADIEELKEWVKEELQKTEAGAQAAAIEELQGQVKDLENDVYTLILTVNIPEDNYEFGLHYLMEGSSTSTNYSGGEVPKYDFSALWGDGSSAEYYTNENWESCSHTYSKAGTYTIKIRGTFEYIGGTGYVTRTPADEVTAAGACLLAIRIGN